MRWLKHAFAVDPPGPAEPNDVERDVVERLARGVVRRGMARPAIMFLEMSQPLNYLSANVMHFFAPVVSAVLPSDAHEHLARFLERRGSMEYICRRIEALEDEFDAHEQATEPPQ